MRRPWLWAIGLFCAMAFGLLNAALLIPLVVTSSDVRSALACIAGAWMMLSIVRDMLRDLKPKPRPDTEPAQ